MISEIRTRWFAMRGRRLLIVLIAVLTSAVGSTLMAAEAVADRGKAGGPATSEDWKLWNGGFTDGGESPAQWSKEGNVRIARDTKTFKEGPASLRVDSDGGTGSALQWVELPGARTFTIRGFMKTTGDAKAQVAVQSIARDWSKNDWKQVKFATGDSDWQAFEQKVQLPEWTSRFRVILQVDGKGSAWMDEVAVGNQPVQAGRTLDPAKDEPLEGKPWEPAWCVWDWRGAWMGLHDRFVERTRAGGVDVIFYGDSITMGWKDRWNDAFAPLKAVNYGIGGDSTRQLLWRIGHGEVDGIQPKLVVLMIGTNNLYGDKNAGTDEEIARGIEAVVSLLRDKLPKTKILLCSILPRQNEYFCNRIRKINTLIAGLADKNLVRILDMKSIFMKQEPGAVKTGLYVEQNVGASLHPNDKGYDAMTEVMKPVISEMLK